MKLLFFCAIGLLYSALPSVSSARFMCYFPNWSGYRSGPGNFPVGSINPNLCTHLLYAFTVLDPTTYTIKVYDSWADISLGGYSKFVALKKQNPNLKTMISIGGWTDSTDGTNKYSKLAASSANIATFVNSVMAFLQLYGFDGLDVDWEYPSTAADKVNYVKLMQALRAAFNSKGYLLSAATTASVSGVNAGYDLRSLAQSLDFINLMTYDMHGSWEYSKADHHAPLYKRSWDTDPTNNIDSVVQHYISSGFPASKINLGIPLYGNAWTLSSSVVTPPAPAAGGSQPGSIIKAAGVLSYSEICYNVLYSGWKVVQNSQGLMGPYAYSPSIPIQWVGYDDPAFATVKANYVLSKGLGGAMVWDISEDDFGNRCGGGANPVITAISRVMLGNNPTTTTTGKPTTTTTGKPPTTTTGRPTTTTTGKPTTTTTGKPTTTTTRKPTTTTTRNPATTTKPGPFKCPGNGLFANPASCFSFYSCGNGIAHLMNCPTGLVFNPTINNCDWPYKVPSCNSG